MQHHILAALSSHRDGWVRPRDILNALGRASTASNRAAVSRALRRLWERDLIEVGHGEIMSAGKSYLYRRRP